MYPLLLVILVPHHSSPETCLVKTIPKLPRTHFDAAGVWDSLSNDTVLSPPRSGLEFSPLLNSSLKRRSFRRSPKEPHSDPIGPPRVLHYSFLSVFFRLRPSSSEPSPDA
ncbi:hypothetical protein L596_014520 [Steinernema carpocapsae]|uniref:Uncharacterized protein n=1 Tax=Steinernema carpocapsae TaxID=34508 RepID=A0A4U5NC80_STECR|nr:hypothetical protein L596_014520 [Steinernema carpocapsae]